jgi:hypothetical protein
MNQLVVTRCSGAYAHRDSPHGPRAIDHASTYWMTTPYDRVKAIDALGRRHAAYPMAMVVARQHEFYMSRGDFERADSEFPPPALAGTIRSRRSANLSVAHAGNRTG